MSHDMNPRDDEPVDREAFELWEQTRKQIRNVPPDHPPSAERPNLGDNGCPHCWADGLRSAALDISDRHPSEPKARNLGELREQLKGILESYAKAAIAPKKALERIASIIEQREREAWEKAATFVEYCATHDVNDGVVHVPGSIQPVDLRRIAYGIRHPEAIRWK